MKKINYISIEIRSDGKNDIFTTDYDLMFETDEQVCIKHGEKLEILTLKKRYIENSLSIRRHTHLF